MNLLGLDAGALPGGITGLQFVHCIHQLRPAERPDWRVLWPWMQRWAESFGCDIEHTDLRYKETDLFQTYRAVKSWTGMNVLCPKLGQFKVGAEERDLAGLGKTRQVPFSGHGGCHFAQHIVG